MQRDLPGYHVEQRRSVDNRNYASEHVQGNADSSTLERPTMLPLVSHIHREYERGSLDDRISPHCHRQRTNRRMSVTSTLTN